MKNYFAHSYESDTTETTQFQLETHEDVVLVDITVTIIGLTHGILMQATSKHERKKINAGGEQNPFEFDEPVLAVVSGFNGISNELSHLLSLPLKNITPSFQSKSGMYEFLALWPAPDLEENQHSTLTFTRKVKRTRNYDHDTKEAYYSYSSERLVLAVSLMKGSEMITLGRVNVPFSYSEKKVHCSLPVRTNIQLVKQAAAEIKGLKFRPKKTKFHKSTSVKPLAFCDNSKRVYSFHEDSMLSVLIQTQATQRSISSRRETLLHGLQNQLSPNVHVNVHVDDLSQSDNFGVSGGNSSINFDDNIDYDGRISHPDEESSQSHNSSSDKSLSSCTHSFLSPTHSISDLSLDSNSSQSNTLIEDAFISIKDNANDPITTTSTNNYDGKSLLYLSEKVRDATEERVELNNEVQAKKTDNYGFFPTVRVNSSISFDSIDDQGFPSSSTSSEAKDDTFTTSSWTFTSWLHQDFL